MSSNPIRFQNLPKFEASKRSDLTAARELEVKYVIR